MSCAGGLSRAPELPWERGLPRLRGRRVLVMGLGLFGGGVGAVKWALGQGARVTVTDLRSGEELRESLAALEGADLELHLGGHREEDFRRADLVIFSPAVPLESPWLRLARRVDTAVNIFFRACRSRRIVGITGSNGKSTTAALAHEVLRRGGTSWLGGNFGGSLLGMLEHIGPDDPVVLELSSFQLEALGAIGRAPHVAVVTNLLENHLDRHGTMEAYAAAKEQITLHQSGGDVKVLNADDARVSAFRGPARTVRFGLREADVRMDGEEMVLDGARVDLRGRRLPGRFQLYNYLAAAAASRALWRGSGWAAAAADAFRSFAGLPHRLELVAEIDGVRYVNDSIATNPAATLAALEAVGGPVLAILGGAGKGLSFEPLRSVARRIRFAALLGPTAPAIREVLAGVESEMVPDLEAAVRACAGRARPGDTVLLSPACASFDAFRNFEERGDRFRRAVLGKR